MKKTLGPAIIGLLLALAATALPAGAAAPRLRVLTINAWSGLDYVGSGSFGEYEPKERRERRHARLVEGIRALDPDIIFLQEMNPVGRAAGRLAAELGFTAIHQVENGGIKLGPLGLPSNFKEGMAILARPSLGLRRKDAWKLSGPFGLFGDVVTFHFDEAVFALVGKVTIGETPVYLVNTHLIASAADDDALFARFREAPEGRALPEAEFKKAVAETKAKVRRRQDDARQLRARIAGLPRGAPVIVGGDFNADPDTPAVRTLLGAEGMIDTLSVPQAAVPARAVTWDAEGNENIAWSSRPTDASGRPRTPLGLLDAFDARVSRRLDYILLGDGFRPEDVAASSVVLGATAGGVHASDHYGVFAEVDCARIIADAPREPKTVVPPGKMEIEPFPILMWDTDIGTGYGAKGFILNPLGLAESFDLTAFNSTKGERWYRFVFSLPDFELRQGKTYPLAFDLTVDYDKMIANNFFGVGSASRAADGVSYTREPLEISLRLSRGFTSTAVGQMGLKYGTVRNSPKEGAGPASLPAGLDLGRVSYASIFGVFRYDDRDSYVHPSEGVVLQAEAEYAPRIGGTVSFGRAAAWFQYYTVLFYPKTIFAFRLGGQSLFGDALPTQILLPLGGNQTLRGYPQDRFLDKAQVLVNAEIRFPIAGRLGGVVGLDAGKVAPSFGSLSFKGWAANPTVGLRFAMDTFVVRMDVGFGPDGTGLYFNFGHIF